MSDLCQWHELMRPTHALLILILAFSNVAHAAEATQTSTPKNIILIIGDGMGPQQLSLVLDYFKYKQQTSVLQRWQQESYVGVVGTNSYEALVTDSAAAATALACGEKTRNGILGLKPDGMPCTSIVQGARKLGKAIGLVTNTSVTDATPAAFLGHVVSRKEETKLAQQYLHDMAFDLLWGGGAEHWTQAATACAAPQQTEACTPAQWLQYRLQNKQVQVLRTADELNTLPSTAASLGIFANKHLPHAQSEDRKNNQLSLPTLVRSALGRLEKDPDGFFLMIESGLIDKAAHLNDASTMLKEMIELEQVAQLVQDFQDKHPDTLVVLTADHETGSFGLSYREAAPGENPPQTLASGAQYSNESLFAPPHVVFLRLLAQPWSFSQLLDNLKSYFATELRVYEQAHGARAVSMAAQQAAVWLQKKLATESAYRLDLEQAKSIVASLNNEQSFFIELQAFWNKPEQQAAALLARGLSPQNFAVWGSGQHTAIPVPLLIRGPHREPEKVRGFIDNAELGKWLQRQWATP